MRSSQRRGERGERQERSFAALRWRRTNKRRCSKQRPYPIEYPSRSCV